MGPYLRFNSIHNARTDCFNCNRTHADCLRSYAYEGHCCYTCQLDPEYCHRWISCEEREPNDKLATAIKAHKC